MAGDSAKNEMAAAGSRSARIDPTSTIPFLTVASSTSAKRVALVRKNSKVPK
jgi:hypothetical protein